MQVIIIHISFSFLQLNSLVGLSKVGQCEATTSIMVLWLLGTAENKIRFRSVVRTKFTKGPSLNDLK